MNTTFDAHEVPQNEQPGSAPLSSDIDHPATTPTVHTSPDPDNGSAAASVKSSSGDAASEIGDDVRISVRDVRDYTKDPRNPNKGRPRGDKMIADSFRKSGAGRSILADRDGQIIAGNHAIDGAAAAGIRRVIEVETDGGDLVVVKRRDLDLDDPEDQRARLLSYADNQTTLADVEFDAIILMEDMAAGIDLTAIFRGDEIDDLIASAQAAQTVEDAERAAGGDSQAKLRTTTGVKVKVVLVAPDVKVIEQAIGQTGIMNRGDALTEICRFYMAHRQ